MCKYIKRMKIKVIDTSGACDPIWFDDIGDVELYIEEGDSEYSFRVTIFTDDGTIKESFDDFEEMVAFIDETYDEFSKTII